MHKLSSWTPWLKVESGQENGLLERRFRVECAAEVDSLDQVRVRRISQEDRRCNSDGRCSKSFNIDAGIHDNSSGWSSWSEWSECDEQCGSGTRRRTRVCKSAACPGASTEERSCNEHKCRGINHLYVFIFFY